MKTYKINEIEIPESELRRLISENPELIEKDRINMIISRMVDEYHKALLKFEKKEELNKALLKLADELNNVLSRLELPIKLLLNTVEESEEKEEEKKSIYTGDWDGYYFIGCDDGIHFRYWGRAFDSNNAYKTKAEAEKELKKRKALASMRKYVIENDMEFEIVLRLPEKFIEDNKQNILDYFGIKEERNEN